MVQQGQEVLVPGGQVDHRQVPWQQLRLPSVSHSDTGGQNSKKARGPSGSFIGPCAALPPPQHCQSRSLGLWQRCAASLSRVGPLSLSCPPPPFKLFLSLFDPSFRVTLSSCCPVFAETLVGDVVSRSNPYSDQFPLRFVLEGASSASPTHISILVSLSIGPGDHSASCQSTFRRPTPLQRFLRPHIFFAVVIRLARLVRLQKFRRAALHDVSSSAPSRPNLPLDRVPQALAQHFLSPDARGQLRRMTHATVSLFSSFSSPQPQSRRTSRQHAPQTRKINHSHNPLNPLPPPRGHI